MLWITPIRALAKEIQGSSERLLDHAQNGWRCGVRTGDTSSAEKQRQDRRLPEILITTPESLHVLLAKKGAQGRFGGLEMLVVDEWHDLLGTKRGVQMELAAAVLKGYAPNLRIWGISATIGNLNEALTVLMGQDRADAAQIVRADIQKRITLESVMPAQFEKLPWAGHLGVQLLDRVVDIIRDHASTLVFTNTRAQSEIWYQKILEAHPDLSGAIALHHGSISKDLRFWVEDALHDGRLKAVVCTSFARPWRGLQAGGGDRADRRAQGGGALCAAGGAQRTPTRGPKAAFISCRRLDWSCSRPPPCAMRCGTAKLNRAGPWCARLMSWYNSCAPWRWGMVFGKMRWRRPCGPPMPLLPWMRQSGRMCCPW